MYKYIFRNSQKKKKKIKNILSFGLWISFLKYKRFLSLGQESSISRNIRLFPLLFSQIIGKVFFGENIRNCSKMDSFYSVILWSCDENAIGSSTYYYYLCKIKHLIDWNCWDSKKISYTIMNKVYNFFYIFILFFTFSCIKLNDKEKCKCFILKRSTYFCAPIIMNKNYFFLLPLSFLKNETTKTIFSCQ